MANEESDTSVRFPNRPLGLGIDVQLLSMTAPEVQVFDAESTTALAIESNDQVVEAIRKYLDCFAGLAAVAPQDPGRAVKEIDRGINSLGLNGIVINSHTKGEYLDDEKYWAIFEAAETADAAIYIYPHTAAPAIGRYREAVTGQKNSGLCRANT